MKNIADLNRHYSVALSKGAAMVEETRTLLKHWRSNEDPHEYAQRVQENDLIGKATAYRTRDLVLRVFKPRLLSPSEVPARCLQNILLRGIDRRILTELLFLYAARADNLLYDFTVKVFWPACDRGDLILRTDDVLAFLSKAHDDGIIPEQWSQNVQIKLARGILGALRDFGFIREEKRAYREIIRYRLTDQSLAYIAHDLHFGGLSDAAVCEHSDWNLFGMGRNQVVERLDELDDWAGLLIQRAGSVVRISWSHKDMEGLINGLP